MMRQPILPLAAVRLLLACGRQRLERGSTRIAVRSLGERPNLGRKGCA